MRRGLFGALIAPTVISASLACQRVDADVGRQASTEASIQLLEIVTEDVDAVVEFYERLHGLSFGPPDPDLGEARVATRADGTLVGIRSPLADHDTPIMRTYVEVEDIHEAVRKAQEAGAILAYGPMLQGRRGTYAILFLGDVQHGLWQR